MGRSHGDKEPEQALEQEPGLEKHSRYRYQYKPNDIFWGLGIEREAYLETTGSAVPASFFNKQRPERYSVDYFKSYKSGVFQEALEATIDLSQTYDLPILINAHALTKTDIFGEPATLYKKDTPPNPAYSGKSVFDEIQTIRPWFKTEYENSYTFDGDTIELMTQNFYKATIASTVKELRELVQIFESELTTALALLPKKAPHLSQPVRWMQKNYGIVRMATNLSNIGIFNNGTYHINITLPTELDASGNIKDMIDFTDRHRYVIHLYQWLEPLLIAEYGTGDVMTYTNSRNIFARGSLRCALSRYIGIGTYDTKKMPCGKVLTVSREGAALKPWMTTLANIPTTAYASLEQVGLDINFNKHHNHGIEFRIFDWFPENRLEELMIALVHAADAALQVMPSSPTDTVIWNDLVVNVLLNGTGAMVSKDTINAYMKLIKAPLVQNNMFVTDVWTMIKDYIIATYSGDAVDKMIGGSKEAPIVTQLCKLSLC